MPFKCTLSRPTALAKAPQPCLNSCSAEPAKARTEVPSIKYKPQIGTEALRGPHQGSRRRESGFGPGPQRTRDFLSRHILSGDRPDVAV
jgi:hypothetical protein